VSNRRGYKCSWIVVDFKSRVESGKKIMLRSNKALFLPERPSVSLPDGNKSPV